MQRESTSKESTTFQLESSCDQNQTLIYPISTGFILDKTFLEADINAHL